MEALADSGRADFLQQIPRARAVYKVQAFTIVPD